MRLDEAYLISDVDRSKKVEQFGSIGLQRMKLSIGNLVVELWMRWPEDRARLEGEGGTRLNLARPNVGKEGTVL